MTADPHWNWSAVLRAVREARGVTQEGWAARLGVSRATVQRWESGASAPDPGAEAAILAYCREVNLFRHFDRGPLAGLNLTPDLLQDLVAGARMEGGNRQPAAGSEEVGTPHAAPPPPHSNLPLPLTSFVGRQQELTTVRRLQAGTRLLTLTGAGGVGKTRLALALAGELLWAYPEGIGLVELAPLADPALVPATVAAALSLWTNDQQPATERLVEHLRAQHLLLVLDNCEHLLGTCALLVETLLRACPNLEVVITSREPLGIGGETIWRVPPMTVPGSGFRGPSPDAARSELEQADAVRLFVERAQQYRADLTLSSANEAAVVEVCTRLDGIPLAIELAAACVKMLSVEQIAARLSDRFRLLTGGRRTALPRHQTLRATLDWSYGLLSEPERALLRRLAVFAGGWSLEAAEAVCGAMGNGQWAIREDDLQDPIAPEHDVLDMLRGLVDKSLVIVEQHDSVVRYRLLETVRQYAAEKLAAAGEAAATQNQHALWCLALAEAAWPHRMGPKQQTWLDRLTAEHDNLRASLGWCLAGERGGPLGLQLGGLLWWWWQVRGHLEEGRRWLAALLERGGHAPPDVRARALEGAAWLAMDQGDYDEAARLDEECLALQRELGEKAGIAGALNNLGVVFDMRGDHARAQELYEESLTLARELGDPTRIARALNNLGIAARQRGEPDRAVPFYEESLALAREMRDAGLAAKTSLNLGHAHQDQGALDQAVVWYRESLTLCRDLHDRQNAARCLQGMAAVAVARGDVERAARLCGAAAALREAIGVQLPASGRASFEKITAGARAALGEAAFTAAWNEGQAMAAEEAVAYALAEAAPA